MTPTNRNSDIPPAPSRSKFLIVIQLVLILVILAGGWYGHGYLSAQKEQPRRRPPAKLAPLVQTQILVPTTHAVQVSAMGTVIPSRELVLKPRVGGQVMQLHPQFTVGGLIKAGEEMVVIDDSDFAIAVTRAKGRLVEAEHALNVEMGYQQVAKKEWELLNGRAAAKDANQNLALRKSHLMKAQAQVTTARAELEKARLDLARTRLTAPFNAMIRERRIDEGAHVGTQENLATLVGTDTYWVQVSLPIDRLAWLHIPRNGENSGSVAVIDAPSGATFKGQVIRLLGDISDQGRMARILVAVADPLGLQVTNPNAPVAPLLLGAYVRVTITGRKLADVYAIPRAALRDNREIWVAREDATLEIRSVSPLWRDDTQVYLKERVNKGDRLIISDLAGPVDGMPLKVDGLVPDNDKAQPSQSPETVGQTEEG